MDNHWRQQSGRALLYGVASLVIAAPLVLAALGAAHAGKEVASAHCGDGHTEVRRAKRNDFALICSAATGAIEFLRNCGLRPPSRLRIEVTKEEIHVDGIDACGCFDVESDTIKLLDLRRCTKAAAANKAYAALPADQFYTSVVAHEVAHRVFRSNLGERTIPRVGHEYVAYAVQITLMPVTVRREFLAPIKRSHPTDLSRFDDMLLLMAPEVFSSMSYDHFSAPGNGCKLLRDLLLGTHAFPIPEAFYWLE